MSSRCSGEKGPASGPPETVPGAMALSDADVEAEELRVACGVGAVRTARCLSFLYCLLASPSEGQALVSSTWRSACCSASCL